MSTAEQSVKYKTTLYLTKENRKRLQQMPKGNMTTIINQAIAEKLERMERGQARQVLLDALDTGKRSPSKGIPTEEAVRTLRQQSVSDAVES